ncbi:hypothetical protein [Streptomyces sp. NPDC051000]|uniref:hypothetical protein n=1 Tax=Streptomyces sp. NPDC051000 TaxID=3155520 RepID=UPI0033FFBABA
MQPALVERDAVAPLVAAQPAGAARAASGVKISPQRIHELRTFRGIGSALREDTATSNRRLVTLNATGTPLLLVPPAGGGVVGPHRLGGNLADRPVHGLQALTVEQVMREKPRQFSTEDRDDPADIAATPGPVADWPGLGLSDHRQYAVPVDHFEMIDHAPTLEAVEAVMAELDGAAS